MIEERAASANRTADKPKVPVHRMDAIDELLPKMDPVLSGIVADSKDALMGMGFNQVCFLTGRLNVVQCHSADGMELSLVRVPDARMRADLSWADLSDPKEPKSRTLHRKIWECDPANPLPAPVQDRLMAAEMGQFVAGILEIPVESNQG